MWYYEVILFCIKICIVINKCYSNKSYYFRTQKALKQKSLVSKFLYHSLVEGDSQADEGNNSQNKYVDQKTVASAKFSFKICSPLQHYPLQSANTTLQTPPLPDPSPSSECPDSHPFEFNRNVVWTFEDIEMLLGTDMPIFGGGTHPCISLRYAPSLFIL